MFESGEFHDELGSGSLKNKNGEPVAFAELYTPETASIPIWRDTGRKTIQESPENQIEISIGDNGNVSEKELLLQSIDKYITDDGKLKHFKEDLNTFEKRANDDNLPDSELEDTFGNIRRILEDTENPLHSDRDRMILALQVMHHAAKPYLIDQGNHDTCVLSTLEVRAYTRIPSKASKLVADIATQNSFYTKDNTKIDLDRDSLVPDEEAKREIPRDGQRSFASQIFAITAVNVFWMRTESDMEGNAVDKGSFRFAQFEELRRRQMTFDQGRIFLDFGERVIDMRPNPPKVLYKGPVLPSRRI